jgi:hypothetical protein
VTGRPRAAYDMDDTDDSYLVSAAAAALLEQIEWDAVELFARHLSGDRGEVSEAVHRMNKDPASERRLSCYWHDREAALGLAVVEEGGLLAILTTTELAAAEVHQTPHSRPGLH